MAKKDKKNKDINNPAVNPANPYEKEKKKHPILNFFIIFFVVLLVIDIGLLVLFFINMGMPPNPKFAEGKWIMTEGTLNIGDADINLSDANGTVTLTLGKADENNNGTFTLEFVSNTEGVEAIKMGGTWQYGEGATITLKSTEAKPLIIILGDYKLNVPFIGGDTLVRESNSGNWSFKRA